MNDNKINKRIKEENHSGISSDGLLAREEESSMKSINS